MRSVLPGLLPLLLAATGESTASSFVSPLFAAEAASPSIVMLGTPEAPVFDARLLGAGNPTEASAPEILVLSPSMIAMGADAIPATREAVASIGETQEPRKARWRPESMPLVFRGGVVGDAFTAAPAAMVTPPAQKSAAQAPQRPAGQNRAPSQPAPIAPASAPSAPTLDAL